MAEGDVEPHAAVQAVSVRAKILGPAARARLAKHGITAALAEAAMAAIRSNARLTLNFHPDRRDSLGRTVAAGLASDGRYRSQFETGISNGQRTAVPGGDRDQWEAHLFDRVYSSSALVRPVYGALDLFHDSFGGAPRFGSCFVVLAPACLDRATFTVGDSHLGPTDVGTLSCLTSIVAGAVDECAGGLGFGRQLSVDILFERLASPTSQPSARELDRYVEAQVHGGIDLARDVVAIVADPSFAGTEVERDLSDAAHRYGFELGWHEGSEVHPGDIDPRFRGPNIAELAHRVARPDGVVDAAAIGRALDYLDFTPPSLSGDPEGSPLQTFKKLWHCCLHFGIAAKPAGGNRSVPDPSIGY